MDLLPAHLQQRGNKMHPTKVSQDCVELVKKFEGLHKLKDDGLVHSYRCPANKWTLGYGATKGIRSGMRCTIEEAEHRLIADLDEHGKIVKRLVNVPLTQGQLFVFFHARSI